MQTIRTIGTNLVLLAALSLLPLAFSPARAAAAQASDSTPTAARPVSFLGTVQSISGQQITVKSDAGATMNIAIQDGARLLRIEPGQTSLQGASPFALSDLQVGDRVLARGSPSGNGKQLAATMLVAIKKADIAQKQQQEREDWQKRGVGGLVKSVDPAAGTVVLSVAAGRRTLTVQVAKNTVIRRYAPGSVEFDQAQPATLAETKPGDQLRALGNRSTDGQTLVAEEIVSGSFRNIAGQISSIDDAAATLTVKDLATKHDVVVHVTPQTQIKKLDPAVAQRIALRLKGGAGEAPNPPNAGAPHPGPGQGSGPGAEPGRARFGGAGGGDPQQLIARAPDATLKDFPKGSAVLLVATEGTSPDSITAISVVGGVEPMLQASASGSQAFLSSAWNLGGGGGGGDTGDAGGGGGGPQ